MVLNELGVVDDWIVDEILEGDIVIMLDILFVVCCFEKNVFVLVYDGCLFVDYNIGEVFVMCDFKS